MTSKRTIVFSVALLSMFGAQSSAQESRPIVQRALTKSGYTKVASSNGKYDFAALATNNSCLIFFGDGSGTFSQGPTLSTGTQGSSYADHSVVVGDFNGDNKPDLAMCDQGANTISVYLGKGDGTFGARNSYVVGTTPIAIGLMDYDHDGRLDLAVANNGSHDVSILRGNGLGGFTLTQTISVGATRYPRAIAACCMNGLPTIVVATTASIFILRAPISGTFQIVSTISVTGAAYFYSLALADFDNNGTLDAAVCSSTDSCVYVFRGLSADSVSRLTSGISAPVSLVASDLDGKNGPDLAVANNTASSVTVLLNDGRGNFQAQKPIQLQYPPNGIYSTDLDGDGDLDLIVSNISLGYVYVLTNAGDGSFGAPKTVVTGPPYLLALGIGDFNRDRSDIPAGQLGIDDNDQWDWQKGKSGVGFGWFNQLTPSAYPATIEKVRALFSGNVPLNTRITLAVYIDGENNGPENGQSPKVRDTVTVYPDSDKWCTFGLSTPVRIDSGSFIVGFIDNLSSGGLDHPATMSAPGLSSPPGSRSFETSDGGSTFASVFATATQSKYLASYLIRAVPEVRVSASSTQTGRFNGGIPPSTWVLMSIPYRLDNTAASTLSSQLSGDTPWKLYACQNGQNADVTNAADAFTVKRGFWFKTTSPSAAFNLNFGSGRLVTGSTDTLTIPSGWSLVGPPFYYEETSWAPVDTIRGSPHIRVFKYLHENNAGWQLLNPTTERMKPYGGYAVYNATGGPATFTFIRGGPLASIQEWHSGDGWYGVLAVGETKLRIGQHRMASEGVDALDYPMPPPRLETEAQDPYVSDKLWSDIKPLAEHAVTQWKVTVDPRTTQCLKLQELVGLPEGWEVMVDGVPNLGALKVKVGEQIRFSKTISSPIVLTVLVGPAELVKKEALPTQFSLDQNYPNPFNPSTTIRFVLPKAANVSLKVYNTLGQLVAALVDEHKEAGDQQVQWNANVPSGIYFFRLMAGEFVETKKAILLK